MANNWHMKPSELGLCRPEDDFIVMSAYTRTATKIQVFDAELQEREAKSKAGQFVKDDELPEVEDA